MKTFFEHFFKYYPGWNGVPGPYSDGLGAGAFSDWRHYFWMVLVIAICVAGYQLFKRHPQTGKKVILILMVYLFTVRLSNQIFRAVIGAEVPVWEALPFHMCTVMTFVMPIVVVFNIKPLKTPIYVLSMMGGIVTILNGDYFNDLFLSFAAMEGIVAHSIMVIVPILEIAVGGFRLEWKKVWTVFVGIIVLMLWATLANEVFFKAYDPNYMYLRHNGLPGDLGGHYYFLVYTAIFALLLGLIFGIPSLSRHYRAKHA
jgi:uncharacterized membrane protein YwaF